MERADTLHDLATALRAAGGPTREATVEPSAPAPPRAGAPASARDPRGCARLARGPPSRPRAHHPPAGRRAGTADPLGELRDRARAVAAGLQARGLRRGDSVALMLRTEEAFFPAFFGILFAGGVPVPIYPPFRRDRIDEYATRQVGILRTPGRASSSPLPRPSASAPCSPRACLAGGHPTVAGSSPPPRRRPRSRLRPDEPALIQYTSGAPATRRACCSPTPTSWRTSARSARRSRSVRRRRGELAPLYHDMGLIGSWLGGAPLRHSRLDPLAAGVPSRPARWLRRSTPTAAPCRPRRTSPSSCALARSPTTRSGAWI